MTYLILRDAVERVEGVPCASRISDVGRYLPYGLFLCPDFIYNEWVDWSYSSIGWYWTVMGPAGFFASWWLSSRANIRTGQVNRRAGLRWGLHWAAFGATGVLGVALALSWTYKQGRIWNALGSASCPLLYLSGRTSGASPAADRRDAGRWLPDNPLPA